MASSTITQPLQRPLQPPLPPRPPWQPWRQPPTEAPSHYRYSRGGHLGVWVATTHQLQSREWDDGKADGRWPTGVTAVDGRGCSLLSGNLCRQGAFVCSPHRERAAYAKAAPHREGCTRESGAAVGCRNRLSVRMARYQLPSWGISAAVTMVACRGWGCVCRAVLHLCHGAAPTAKGPIARPQEGLTLYTASGVEVSGGGSPRPCSRMYVCTYILSSSVPRRARDYSASTRASPPRYEHGRPALAPLPGGPSPSCAPSLTSFPPLTSGVLAFATALHQSFLISRAKGAHLGPRWPGLFPYRAADHGGATSTVVPLPWPRRTVAAAAVAAVMAATAAPPLPSSPLPHWSPSTGKNDWAKGVLPAFRPRLHA